MIIYTRLPMAELDNIDKLTFRLQKLLEYTHHLRSYGTVSAEKLRSDHTLSSAVERDLELACEITLDIARLVVSDQRLPIPEDSKGFVTALGKASIIPVDFARDFAKIAGFRNILVHMYLEIDPDQIADKVNRQLGNFELFATYIARFYDLKHP